MTQPPLPNLEPPTEIVTRNTAEFDAAMRYIAENKGRVSELVGGNSNGEWTLKIQWPKKSHDN